MKFLFNKIFFVQLILIYFNKISSLWAIESRTKRDVADFSLRIFDVDSNKAYFEIVDDKKTTFNYEISYFLSSNDPFNGDITLRSHFSLQTNPVNLIEKEENIKNDRNLVPNNDLDHSGEFYNDWQIKNIRNKNYTDIHVFHINDLEPNRSYKIFFKINCTRAHLSLSLLPEQNISSQFSTKTFSFKFKTLFDPKLVESFSCSNSSNSSELSDLLSCYVEKTDCTQCKSHCYQVPSYSKPILCWPCPCDLSRSNGMCIVKKGENFEPEEIKCERCKPPYTGPLCDQCLNEGFDYYKNDLGECVACNCNNNSYFDSFRMVNSSELRKCNSNGFCHSCMYNTSGQHCDKCANGFEGDALKRTCQPIVKTIKIVETSKDQQHSYRNLALFAFYIFLVLFIILSVFVCIKIKLESTPLKNDQIHLISWFGDCFLILKRTKNRASAYLRNLRFFANSTGTNSNSIYNRARLNDDDRLNLAEHPVFDDNLIDDAFVYNPADDFDTNRNKNPYTNLTVKT